MKEWRDRLTSDLEPVLKEPDPRQGLSAYHDMPYAIFWYPPEAEFALRREVTLLRTRLEQVGKRVITVSLAECLSQALEAEGLTMEELGRTEQTVGIEKTVETLHEVLSTRQPLDNIVASHVPTDADPLRDIVFIVRAGALFPAYRTSPLLDQLQGKLRVPAVLFYPGTLEGPSGLRFMGVLDAEHNYRPKIF